MGEVRVGGHMEERVEVGGGGGGASNSKNHPSHHEYTSPKQLL